MPFKDPEKKRASQKIWRKKNIEKLRLQGQARYAKKMAEDPDCWKKDYKNNKERYKNKSRLYAKKYPEKKKEMDKKYRKENIEKVSQWQAEYYQRNKDIYRQKNKEFRDRFRKWWKAYKNKLVCPRCGESHPACLDIHHIHPKQKESTVAILVAKRSKKRVLSEIRKCIVLCSNCHKKEHFNGEF